MNDILSSSVLVLNRSYIPINVISVKKAFKKLIKGVAEIITVENGNYCNYNIISWAEMSELKKEFNELGKYDELIGGSCFTFIVPRVIRVLTYNKVHRHSIKLNRRNVFMRDDNTCMYCGKKLPSSKLNLDHVIPRCQNGKNTWENLVCCCFKCNQKKAGKTPKQAGMKLIRIPTQPKNITHLKVTIGHNKYKSWEHFVSHIYWTIPLEE